MSLNFSLLLGIMTLTSYVKIIGDRSPKQEFYYSFINNNNNKCISNCSL